MLGPAERILSAIDLSQASSTFALHCKGVHYILRSTLARVDIEQIGLTLPEKRRYQRRPPFRLGSNVSFWLAVDKNNLGPSERARHRWHEAVRRVIEKQQKISGRLPRAPRPRFADIVSIAINCHLVAPKLQNMTISLSHHVDERHSALVRSLQFSPNGKYLVTSRCVAST